MRGDSELVPVSEITTALTVNQLRELGTYTNPADLLDRFDVYDWNHDSEIRELTELAKQNENLSVKLAAIKYLGEVVRNAMKAAGLLVHATKTTKGMDGSTLTLTADLVAASLKGPEPIKPKNEGKENENGIRRNNTGGNDDKRDGADDNGGADGKAGDTDGTTDPQDEGEETEAPETEASQAQGPGVHKPPVGTEDLFPGI